MLRPIAALLPAALTACVAWAWLGAPVAMPPSPLPHGGKLYCVSYAPFRDGQSPLDGGAAIAPAQIEEDLAKLASLTDCVRTYSTELGLDAVPAIAARRGLAVLQGIWIGRNPQRNAVEIERAIALAKAHPEVVRGLIVGNEVLLRGEMAASDLAATIQAVKQRVEVPVTYADVWEFWLRARELAPVVDFITIHILPYWEDEPVAAAEAARHVDRIKRKVAGVFPGRDILIGETGWPSAGRMREGARPSPADQARVIHEIVAIGRAQGYRVNVIEAFDQPWKRRLEGTVGGHWGLLDADTRRFKFAWGRPLSNHPFWPWQAAGGVVMVLLAGAAAHLAARRPAKEVPVSAWIGIALSAAAAGLGVPWAAEALPLESLGATGWLRNGALFALAVSAAPVAAALLASGRPLPGFATALDPARWRAADGVARAAALLLVALVVLTIHGALGLVFDPRYKDFAYPALTAAVVPIAAAAFLGRRAARPAGIAEYVAAAVLAGSAVYVALNETLANWQALWTAGLWLLLALSLAWVRAAPGARS